VDKIKERLAAKKRQLDDGKTQVSYDFEGRVAALQEEDAARKVLVLAKSSFLQLFFLSFFVAAKERSQESQEGGR
jgi:hypothetical protein